MKVAILGLVALLINGCAVYPGWLSDYVSASRSAASSSSSTMIIWTNRLFISMNGDDANSGRLPTEPKKSFTSALNLATNWVDNELHLIHVASGVYTPDNGLNSASSSGSGIYVGNKKNVEIIGGFSPDFSTQGPTYTSILKLNNDASHVVRIQNSTNISLRHINLMGGLAVTGQDDFGAGLLIENSSNVHLDAVVISNNRARFGAALYLSNSRHVILNESVIIRSNIAEQMGAAVYCVNSFDSVFSPLVEQNAVDMTAFDKYGCGFHIMGGANIAIRNARIINNEFINSMTVYGAYIRVVNTPNMLLKDNLMTNYYKSPILDVHLVSFNQTSSGGLDNLIIDGNILSGYNGSTGAFFEETNGGCIDVSNHTFINNILNSSNGNLYVIYTDYVYKTLYDSDSYFINTNMFNSTNWTGASVISNNRLTNF